MTDGSEPMTPPRQSLVASILEFFSARLALIGMESRDARRQAARQATLAAITAGAGMIAWLAALVGLIGWLATAVPTIPWYLATLVCAAIHFLIAAIAAAKLRRPAAPVFPLIRTELAKDREWLLNLKDQPKR
ncbi:MAG: hypothetical protein EAZ65_00120 [Verrucomicrobia bacterium]|nr:MAG: hypothetical protein EAZ84_10635 [Verrucomicrobiota bacterium]TAE89371.1 MAG: hypothetical protein EAZ82_01775 [Verrucomicrobiota bacterium]TAF27753.1 MAG: hypothetical protein EAZ71_00120 [Verrucomicrobiota bacterium]TAF42602.1 MAG: hypothetical protein EAZ65_00120 [Verrucomicrobiota bacterium]